MKVFLLLVFNALMLLEAHGFTNDETDRQALLEFKSQISKDKRVVLSSWNQSFPLCNWNGVTCGRKHRRVTSLDLGGLQLGGVISPSIGNLSFLISLNLFNNSFGGTIPQEIGNLFRLEFLDMGINYLQGEIPASLSNCSRLVYLQLDSNYLHVIPSELESLTQLWYLELSQNKFSGVFPPIIYNISLLEELHIPYNHFSGHLRPDFGILLPNLQSLNMGANFFKGVIPPTLSNISTLQKLAMNENNLTGSIPSFGKVGNLQWLILHTNYLGSYSDGDLDFLDGLTNCTNLETLSVGSNRLGGDLPISIANLSAKLITLELGGNLISGRIPQDIGNLRSLQSLNLGGNMLTGPLPTSLGNLVQLGSLDLSSNKMSGELPSSIGNLTRLETLNLNNNSLQGTIPTSLGNCSALLNLQIGYNKLNGTIPQEIMQIPSLIHLNIQDNSLTGSLPKDVGRQQNLLVLSLENNNLSGKLPQALGNCLAMEQLLLQGNSFEGDIPDIKGLVGVKRVDLSNNNLSGSIPEYFANFSSLEYLNLSINNFEGKVPTGGKFHNSTVVLVFGNKNLCGGIKFLKLKPCIAHTPSMKTKHFSLLKKVAMGATIVIAFLLLFFIALCWFIKRKKNQQQQASNPSPSSLDILHEKISYGDLRNATNSFSSSNMVGSGSFGTVFKAFLATQNKTVAVKVLNMQRQGAMKSFIAECESLKDIRHRNLVKLLTACASIDFQGNEFKALIYEFMPNGSLDMWLHPEEVDEIRRPSRTLTLVERLNISVDVASVLDYLHVHCHEPIVHCDLKPNNVLLDNDLTAHVSDFGLARLLLKFDQESFFNQLSSAGVRGTIGYAAPEYGMGGQPSVHGDVYSFGVLLFEMFTGKNPTNELFGGNFTLYSYIKSALPERVMDIADKSIIHSGLNVDFPIAECLTLVLDVGLRCCEESPMNRLATSEATKELISIRESFFKSHKNNQTLT